MVELVAKNYARALFELALEENKLEEIGEELETINKVLETDKTYYEFFVTPLVSKHEKVELIEKAFGGNISKYSENFFKVLVENGRSIHIRGVNSQYKKMRMEYLNMVEAFAYTVIPMTEAQSNKLKEKLEQETGKKVILQNIIEPDIIGGMKIKIGEKEIDATVLNRLKNLEAAISK